MEEIKNLIMSFEDYNQIENISSPKKIEIKNDKQLLYYYGASHLNEVGHPMFEDLKEYWNDFLSKVDKENIIVMNEGGLIKPEDNESIAIKNDGEAGFITHLAKLENIKVISPEPDREVLDKELLKNFNKNEIQFYYFSRVVSQYLRMNPNESFEEYVQKFLDIDIQESNWNDFEFTLDNMKKIHTEIFEDEFSLKEEGFIHTIVNPTRNDTVINAVARESSQLRDAYVVKEIVSKWNEGKNIFVVFSFSHAYKQEPALRSLLK